MKIKNLKSYLFFFMLLGSASASSTMHPTDYVDCFVGTSNSRWMLGPYAQRPFGMVQLGPDNQGNVWMGGYEYSINSVNHFSHIHAWTMGGLAIMPTTADLALSNPSTDSPFQGANAGYHSRIMKDTEKAHPGYYEVYLYDHDVKAEMTTTKRCGFQRYTFPECKESRILVDLQFPTEWDYGFKVQDAKITKVSNQEIEGYAKCQSGSWSSWNNYTLYFVIRVNRPFEALDGWNNGEVQDNIKTITGKGSIGSYMTFKTEKDEQILVQSAVSLVSIDGARKNMAAELDPFSWDFKACVEDARNEWDNLLGKIKIEGGSDVDRRKFYTNLYRAYCGKQTWNDVDGKYRDPKEDIQQLKPNQSIYGGDAFWNSYWNLNGLWSIITPKIVDNWVTTELELYKHTGWLSKGPTGIEYSGIMEGSHEIALMVAAYQKGIRKDGDAIYESIHKMVTMPGVSLPYGGNPGQPQLDSYIKYGYMPSEKGVVSKTLDYAFDDYCVAQMAKALKKKKDATYFEKRSMNYKNVINPETKFVCQRDSNGVWDKNFDVFSNKGFIEGNSWQYSWYVPHDTRGLLTTIGEDLATKRLIEGFEKSRKYRFAAHVFDRTMGQSAEFYINQGNEVNMSSAFLFNYLGRPELCQQYTREILNSFYGNTPYHGWDGDEDEGQMSSWYVMSAMGLFEMNGGVTANSELEITSPLFDKITISLDTNYYTGKEFTIEAINNSPSNIYIKSARLNGKLLKEARIPFESIKEGGRLVLEMDSNPNNACWRSIK